MRQAKHADGVTWFMSKLEAEARADLDSEMVWSVPTTRADRAYNWGEGAIAPTPWGHPLAGGLQVPFYPKHKLRACRPEESSPARTAMRATYGRTRQRKTNPCSPSSCSSWTPT